MKRFSMKRPPVILVLAVLLVSAGCATYPELFAFGYCDEGYIHPGLLPNGPVAVAVSYPGDGDLANFSSNGFQITAILAQFVGTRTVPVRFSLYELDRHSKPVYGFCVYSTKVMISPRYIRFDVRIQLPFPIVLSYDKVYWVTCEYDYDADFALCNGLHLNPYSRWVRSNDTWQELSGALPYAWAIQLELQKPPFFS